MAFKDTDYWSGSDPEDGDDPGKHQLGFWVRLALNCAEDYAVQSRQRYVTVEHLLLVLLQYVQVQGLMALPASQLADMQFKLMDRIRLTVSTLAPSEGVRVFRANDLSLALTLSEDLAHPHPASLLDVLQSIFRLKHTHASKVLREYGITSDRIARARAKQQR